MGFNDGLMGLYMRYIWDIPINVWLYLCANYTVYDLTRLMDLSGVTPAEFAENLWFSMWNQHCWWLQPLWKKWYSQLGMLGWLFSIYGQNMSKKMIQTTNQFFFCFNGIGGLRAPDVQTFVLVRGKCLELRRQWKLGATTSFDDLVIGHDVLWGQLNRSH